MHSEELMKVELKDSEELIWSGRPKPGWTFGIYDLFLIPFSGLWLSFAVFWEITVLSLFTNVGQNDGPALLRIIFPIFGAVFILFGLVFFIGRFIIAAYIRSKTSYGLTNQRIIIVSTFFGKSVRTLQFDRVKELILVEGEKHGSIYFGGEFERYFLGTLASITGLPVSAFRRIEDASIVHEQLRNLIGKKPNLTQQPADILQ